MGGGRPRQVGRGSWNGWKAKKGEKKKNFKVAPSSEFRKKNGKGHSDMEKGEKERRTERQEKGCKERQSWLNATKQTKNGGLGNV